MTVDTVVKIVESEKCGLDMSSYEDLHSSPTTTSLSVANVGDNGNGDVRDDYVFVNDNDVASSDDQAENHENVAENHESVAKLDENHENGEVDVADVVENNENADKLGENHKNSELNGANLSKVHENVTELGENHEEEKVNGANVAENHENVAKLGENHEKEKVNGFNLVKNREHEELKVAKLSVEGDENKNEVIGDVESDRLENGVIVDGDALTVEDGANVEGGGLVEENGEIKSNSEGVVIENGGSDGKIAGEVDVSDSVLEPGVDEVKKDSVPEPVVDEVQEDETVFETSANINASVDGIDSCSLDVDGNNKYSVSDAQKSAEVETEIGTAVSAVPDGLERSEVKEGSVSEPVIDEVKESNNPISVVDEVKEDEPVFEAGDNGGASVDSVDSRSLDVAANNRSCVSDAHESAELVVEDSAAVNSVPDASEPFEVKEGSVMDRVIDDVNESSDPKSVLEEVKEDETVSETADNVYVSADSIVSRSFDVDKDNKKSVSDAQELAVIEAKDSTSVTSIPDDSEPSEVKEGSVPDPVIDEVKESNHPEPVIGEVQEDESVFVTGDDVNGSVVSNGSRSLDVDDYSKNSVYDAQDSVEVRTEDSTATNGVLDAPQPSEVEAHIDTPAVEVPEDELKTEHIGLPLENGIDILESEPERLEEDQAGTQKVTENNSDVLGVNVPVTEVESKDCLVIESKALETNVSDRSIENGLGKPHSVDGDVKASLPLDADCQRPSLPLTDEGNEKQELIEAEAKTDKQDDLDLVAAEKSCELGLDKKGELIDQIDSEPSDRPEETLLNQSEVTQNESDVEFAAPEINDPVGQSGESKMESITGGEENDGAITANTVVDSAAKMTLEDEPKRVDGDGESEVMASPENNVLQNLAVEQARSADVVDKEISQEDCSSEKASTLEDTTNLSKDSKLPYADNRASDADQNDQGGSHSTDDTKSKTYTVDSEIDASTKSNNISDGTSRPKISFGSFGDDINFPSEGLNTPTAFRTVNDEASLNCTENGGHSDGLNNDVTCAEVAHPEQINKVSETSVEGSEAVSSDGQNVNPDLVRRPFYWLIKVPRLDDGKYKDQLRQIEIELDEKTKTRDAFQAEFSKRQAYCRELKSNCDAANSEVKAARELMWAKSREIDSAHSVMNLARHGVTVEDLDKKINDLEHRLQHQTLSNLKEEKELVREIKQLNIERQKLAANRQRQQEIQQARNQRDQTEEQLKVLKKEMDALRDNLSKVDERFRAEKKKHDDESVLLNDLRQQLKSADDIRQQAYSHLRTLKKQLNDKNAPFYKAKDDLRLAYNYVAAGKNDALERHCVNQVEKVMEIWNKHDEFRKAYTKSNMRRTVWKFGTLDGTCLGADEVPPPLADVSNNRVNISAKVNSVTPVLTVKRDLPVESKITEGKLLKKVEQKKAPPAKKNEFISTINLAKDIEKDTEEPKLTKEEEELARKAEQLRREQEELTKKAEESRREEEAARLREQLRLEEKVKAAEALERKRKIAMKAQARAEFKARKEAEEKEKEREKRAMKKQKKRGINSEVTENESAQPSEPSSECVKEPDVTEKPVTTAKRPQKASSLHLKQMKTTKPIPPALRNKGKRGLLRYWPYACIVLLAVALFFLGSVETIQTMKQHISALLHW